MLFHIAYAFFHWCFYPFSQVINKQDGAELVTLFSVDVGGPCPWHLVKLGFFVRSREEASSA